jgi:NADH dehydrogenase [ubiquinone] 1 alpha subcomplex assembly factor 1
MRVILTAVLVVAAVVGCSEDRPETTGPASFPRSGMTEPAPTVGAEPAPTAPPSAWNCVRLAEFTSEEANSKWVVVNDDVMGGRSRGGLRFLTDTGPSDTGPSAWLRFEGAINTDGGGFSSLRLPLEPDTLNDFDRVVFRAKADGRVYMVTFDDNLPGRDRRVSHRSVIPFDGANEWQEVSVRFEDLFPAVFGRPVDDLPFRPDLATRMGLMISDGVDGDFALDIDWIDLCEGPDQVPRNVPKAGATDDRNPSG